MSIGKIHNPVMVKEVIDMFRKALFPEAKNLLFIDGCAGLGGHSKEILCSFPSSRLLCIDRDPIMKEELTGQLSSFGNRTNIITSSYADMRSVLRDEYSDEKANGILVDLGFNSVHVDDATRGFSFQRDGPLDMRYDQSSGVTAADLVNNLDAPSLAAIFSEYSGESLRTSRHVANCILTRRTSQGRFSTTKELADCMNSAIGYNRKHSTTPCTGLFQSLRIAVNMEFHHLDRMMEQLPFTLDHGGVFIALCFQSQEIRRLKMWVKYYLDPTSEWRQKHQIQGTNNLDMLFSVLTPKPMKPSEEEIKINRRSRSTLLYAIQRL